MLNDANSRPQHVQVTNNCSVTAFGYNPYLSEWSPYHGAMYAMVEAVSKMVASGAKYGGVRFSLQEYFEKMTSPESWGKPLAALLGALKFQYEMQLPAIGGKDSMSGSFENINVPPTLIAFGFTAANASDVISPEFKQTDHSIYLIKHSPNEKFLPNINMLKQNFDFVSQSIEAGTIVSAYAIGFGGLAEAVCKMAFGNEIGADITFDKNELFNLDYGSIVVESVGALDFANAVKLGRTTAEPKIVINQAECDLEELWKANTERFAAIYPLK